MQGLLSDIFFFSSRRRHTRLQGDWSSDVCSSDLDAARPGAPLGHEAARVRWVPRGQGEERRNGGEGIDNEQDRREDEKQVLQRPQGLAHIATCTTRSLPARFAAYMAWSALRSNSSVPASVPETATTPTLAVTEGVPRNTVRMPLTSRLAAACATSPSVSGISTPRSEEHTSELQS